MLYNFNTSFDRFFISNYKKTTYYFASHAVIYEESSFFSLKSQYKCSREYEIGIEVSAK